MSPAVAWDDLALELLKHGYHPCSHYEWQCGLDGAVCRVTTSTEVAKPKAERCPQCGRKCRLRYLARGFTKQTLPYMTAIRMYTRPKELRGLTSKVIEEW